MAPWLMLRGLVVVTALAAVLACTGPAGDASPEASSTEVSVQARWALQEIAGTAAVGEAWLEIRDGRLSGTTGCNSFNGDIEQAADGSVKIGPLAVSKRFCPNDALMTQERQLLVLLRGARALEVSQGRLLLHGAGGRRAAFQADR